jgi:hypothetical protein
MIAKKKMKAVFGAVIVTGALCIAFAGNFVDLKRYFTPKLARASSQFWCYCHIGSEQCMVDSWGDSCGPFGYPCNDSTLCEG